MPSIYNSSRTWEWKLPACVQEQWCMQWIFWNGDTFPKAFQVSMVLSGAIRTPQSEDVLYSMCGMMKCWSLLYVWQIGVITPYEGQRAYIVNYMARNGSLRQQLYKDIEVFSHWGHRPFILEYIWMFYCSKLLMWSTLWCGQSWSKHWIPCFGRLQV